MRGGYRKGSLLRTFVDGQYREVVIDHVTSNGRLAQCYWLERGNKRFVTVSLGPGQRAEPLFEAAGDVLHPPRDLQESS
jgi:hypothetical protein